MKLVSACLCGLNCTWKGTDKSNEKIIEMVKRGEAIPVCPEQLGGLPTPREACEQLEDEVVSSTSANYTKDFEYGARQVLALAKVLDANEFIGKAKSPSCGVGLVYDGTFSGVLTKGDGVTVKLLKSHGIMVKNSEDCT